MSQNFQQTPTEPENPEAPRTPANRPFFLLLLRGVLSWFLVWGHHFKTESQIEDTQEGTAIQRTDATSPSPEGPPTAIPGRSQTTCWHPSSRCFALSGVFREQGTGHWCLGFQCRARNCCRSMQLEISIASTSCMFGDFLTALQDSGCSVYGEREGRLICTHKSIF